ncbi:Major facilitator superfamily domain, general substrate transporter [Penicillium italicum]|uniref:Major facilitator superfamily domain, general substrate transporter n=1 Tax=Penicillium italicum TaxID=40296 RepID=A0A0A2L262_PENIT|nr:Major facilitator superfamily domain, general substrate transporter [Penicillium italicum]
MASDNKAAYVELDHYGSKDSPPVSLKELMGREGEEQAAVSDGSDDEAHYPSVWKLIPIMAGLCCSVFCVALDNTIVATAIPKITAEFDSLDEMGWYGSAYMLTSCAVTLIFGKLYTYYSLKWTFIVALTLFELGSLVCGVTPSSTGLIIGRALAGVGAGGLFSGSILVIANLVPLRKRPIFTGLIGAVFGISSVAGPLLGGALTDHATWRWCFYINLPFGAVTAIVVGLFFQDKAPQKEITSREKLQSLDLIGTTIFLPTIVCLLLALQWGGQKYPWSNVRIIVLFVLFGVGLCAWLYVQHARQDLATVPPRIIKNRNVWGAIAYTICIGGEFFVSVYYLPLWFQAIKGASATSSGVMNLPLILGVTIFSMVSAILVTVSGYCNPFMLAASIILSIGNGLLTILEPNSGPAKWIGYQAMTGIGAGLGMQLPTIVVQAAVQEADIPVATTLVTFSQSLSGAIFVSIAQNVFQNRLVANVRKLAPMLDPAVVVEAGATKLREAFPENLHVVLRAYNNAVTQSFYIAVALSALSIFGALSLQWISVKKK